MINANHVVLKGVFFCPRLMCWLVSGVLWLIGEGAIKFFLKGKSNMAPRTELCVTSTLLRHHEWDVNEENWWQLITFELGLPLLYFFQLLLPWRRSEITHPVICFMSHLWIASPSAYLPSSFLLPLILSSLRLPLHYLPPSSALPWQST